MSAVQQLMVGNAGAPGGWKMLPGTYSEVYGIAVSDNGQRIIANVVKYYPPLENDVHMTVHSADYGATWSEAGNLGIPSHTAPMCISSDGMTAYAINSSYNTWIRTTNGGLNWTSITTPSGLARMLKCTGNGTTIYAANYAYNGTFYKSVDSGGNWTTETLASGVHSWNYIGVSRNGQHIAVFDSYSGGLYYSHNGGSSWASSGSPVSDPMSKQIAISDNGQYILICLSSNNPYDALLSTDGGATLSVLTLGNTPDTCAMTANGRIQAITGADWGIWLSVDYGATWEISYPQGLNSSGYMLAASSDNIYMSLHNMALGGKSIYVYKD